LRRVDESNKSFTFRIEGSSFPNWEGTRHERPVTAITPEVLTYDNPTSTNPAAGAIRVELAWKKAKPETVAAANITASAVDISADRLKFAAGVAKAPAYEVPATTYVVANPSSIFSDHFFYGTAAYGRRR
jgi:Lipocalin-like domain